MAEPEGTKSDRRGPIHSMHPGPPGGEALPRDAKVVMAMLDAMGLQEYEPRVVNQFLELMYRYITDVLGDAHAYSEHAGKQNIDADDVQLAIQSRVNFSFTQPPPREILMELTKARNSVPLPPINLKPGIALPPDSDTLIHPNWQVVLPSMPRKDFVEEFDDEPKEGPEGRGKKRSRVHEGEQGEKETEELGVGRNKNEDLGFQGADSRKVSFSVATKKPKV